MAVAHLLPPMSHRDRGGDAHSGSGLAVARRALNLAWVMRTGGATDTCMDYYYWRAVGRLLHEWALLQGVSLAPTHLSRYKDVTHLLHKDRLEAALSIDVPEGNVGYYKQVSVSPGKQGHNACSMAKLLCTCTSKMAGEDVAWLGYTGAFRENPLHSCSCRWCILYFDLHLVISELVHSVGESCCLVVYNTCGPEVYGEDHLQTWRLLARWAHNRPSAPVQVIHLGIQGANDCSIWIYIVAVMVHHGVLSAFMEKIQSMTASQRVHACNRQFTKVLAEVWEMAKVAHR